MEGQVAIVTGGARAIGREICETLARSGATVVSFDLSDSADCVASIEAAGGTAAGIECDVTDEARVQAAVGEVVDRFGRIDVLVNNAGVFSTMARRPFWEIPAEEWDLMMRVNVRSVYLVSKAASAPMREARRGRIVNIASNVFVFGMPEFLHYVASKGAVVGITRGMARELGPYGIAVNAVSPGLVTTEVTQETVPAEYRERVASGQCLAEPLVPSDIAQAVAYLASPAARLVTGQNLLVNGGATMGPS
ncbi:MAG TPA: 3-oxoacyl-ACP reductase family protein [Capillimicrobium sp.]|nr:3-oxoacyl-ACP reductase family protein [Capillimicrobium sp.]